MPDWTWWPKAASEQLVERLQPHPRNLAEVFSDDRWGTNLGRAYWLWIEDSERALDDEETSATATWIIEFFDRPLSPETNFRIFLRDDDSDEETRGFLTVRNRFVLWLSLSNISVDLDGLTSDDMESIVRDDLPAFAHEQSLDWWEKLRKSADRLCEASRLGNLSELEPRTVGEEALLALATRPGYIDWAEDSLEMSDNQLVFDSLPPSPDDGDWEEILPALTGDTDIEMMWHLHIDGIDDPANEINQQLGMGDYRPESWHSLFARARVADESN